MTAPQGRDGMHPTLLDTTPSARRHLLVSVAGGAVLVATWVTIAAFETIPAFEESVLRFVNDLPDWVEYPGWPVMQLGSLLGALFVAVVASAAFRNRRIGIEVMIAAGLAWMVAKVLKELAGRDRPAGFLENLELRPLWDGLGFPSGHSSVAAAIAAVLSVWARGWWLVVIWSIPLLVGFMRLYTAAHFPLDVLAGWGLGVVIGTGVAGLWRHWMRSRLPGAGGDVAAG